MKRGYMYYNNQQPILQRKYHGQGQYTQDQAFCDLETVDEGNVCMIQMSRGHLYRFVCVAADEHSALLVASDL